MKHCVGNLGEPIVVTGFFRSERGGRGGRDYSVKMTDLGDGGSSHQPRKAGSLQRGKRQGNGFSSEDLKRNTAHQHLDFSPVLNF